VLPICQNCRSHGAIPLARTKRRNGAAYAQRAQRDLLTVEVHEAPRPEISDVVTPVEAPGIRPTRTSTAPRTTKRGRRAESETAGKLPRRRLSRRDRG